MYFDENVCNNVRMKRHSLHYSFAFACIVGLYALIELSFNHRLLESAGASLSQSEFDGLQTWGRLIAGFGLSMLIVRWLDMHMDQRWIAVLLSLIVGMSAMWNFQQVILDQLVARASISDKQMSIQLLPLAKLAASGELRLQGQAILINPIDEPEEKTLFALFPVLGLGLQPSDLDAPYDKTLVVKKEWISIFSEETLNKAYRNLISPPITLALSSFFGLLNLAQCVALLIMQYLRSKNKLKIWIRRYTVSGLSLAIILGTWLIPHRLALSKTYTEVLAPQLQQSHAVLYPFVNWSVHAELTWYRISAHIHHFILRDFHFDTLLQVVFL